MEDAEAALRAHARLFDIPGQAVIGTTTDGIILYWNAAAELLYGWPAAEAMGRNVVDVTPTDVSREEANAIMQTLQKGRTWVGEFNVRTRTGSEFRAYVQDVPVRDPSGTLVGIVGVSSPATESP